MIKTIQTVTLLFLFLAWLPQTGEAEDMREMHLQAEMSKQQLFEKAAREKSDAQQRAAESRKSILNDRTRLEGAIKELERRKKKLDEEIAGLQQERLILKEEEVKVTEDLAQTSQMIDELVGVVRVSAKDIESFVGENLQTALADDSSVFLASMAGEDAFPGMESITRLADVLLDQIALTSEVFRVEGEIIDRDGKEVKAEILVLGPFCAAYRVDNEIGFLRYSSSGKRLYALSKLPPKRMQKKIQSYMEGESVSVVMDIGRGAALQQLSHSLTLWEQIEEGGPIVWPILVIFGFGLLIVLERILFLFRKHFRNENVMNRLHESIRNADWSQCEDLCSRFMKKPVMRILLAGIQSRHLKREEVESVLQEAILREIQPMERFLSTLGMLAAIAPLLGLLGTVTGMIDTFHVITLHGTSDPRLMSGGISEALVTTMLGLGVAIPLMLSQTLLNRSIEKEIGTMEEKAVSLVNLLHKSRLD
jgi:biopolymer transport protein ExbB